jgi:hypothetical protein
MHAVIGVDPHKVSHTAVAIDEAEDELSSVKVRATSHEVEQVVRWAEPFEKRRWARVGRRNGLPAGTAARGTRRRGARCSGHLGASDPRARHRSFQRERSQ